jgi:hypothetical protein
VLQRGGNTPPNLSKEAAWAGGRAAGIAVGARGVTPRWVAGSGAGRVRGVALVVRSVAGA